MNLSPNPFWLVAIAGMVSAFAPASYAGPWMDSWFGRRPPAYPVGTPVTVGGQTSYMPVAGYVPPSYAPYAGSQLAGGVITTPYVSTQTVGYGGYASLMPPVNNAPVFAPGVPQTVAGYLPTAAYDSVWNRVPVTYYRPVTAYDPRYGTTVTSLQPCTSYQYQTQRPPTIAPRPLLGDYGLQANKWPSITGPGYNPTGLAVTSGYPSMQPYQSFPNVGAVAITPTVPSSMPPMASSGTSLGMPATSLPATAMNYNPLSPLAPMNPAPTTANYLPGGWQSAVNPTATQPFVVSPYGASMVGSTQPAAAWMPSNCANGTCSQASAPTATPYIPGAASVTPVGPPTYTPAPGYGAGSAPPTNPGYLNNPGSMGIPTTPNVMPNNQILPPGTGIPGLADPESVRQPGLSNAMNAPLKPEVDVRTLPMVAIDRGTNNTSRLDSLSGGPGSEYASRDLAQTNSINADNNISLGQSNFDPPKIPDTLNRKENTVQPLVAPSDFDSKPRWNPSLLEPEERSVVGGMDNSSNSATIRDVSIRRVRLTADEMPGPGFRPVTKLK